MREVSVVGIGQTKVKEHWDKSLRQLATEAILGAMKDAHVDNADALYVGNMLSGELTPLNLYAERWLPAEERSAIYSKKLRVCLLAHDWAEANPLFAQLEGLGLPLPGSFFYHYGRSLLLSGETKQGQSYLRRYLEQAGSEGEYQQKAQQMLGGKPI